MTQFPISKILFLDFAIWDLSGIWAFGFGISVPCTVSSLAKAVYNPKTFILHAALLLQAFAH